MKESIEPSIYGLVDGDLLGRTNLLRWIREFVRGSQMGPGYYMEFGVLNGESMVDAYRQLRGCLSHLYGFDSFAGLPELDASDQRGAALMPSFYAGNFKGMRKDLVFESVVNACRMPRERLTLVEGIFSNSLPLFDKTQLVHQGVPLCINIDCDLYSSTLDVLGFIEDLIVDGTWILLDDFWTYRGNPNFGPQKAFIDWLRDNPRVGATPYGNYRGFGRAFIAYRKMETD